MLRVRDTVTTTINMVHYQETNFMGRLHGGDMLKFLADSGMLASMRVAKGFTVLASLDQVLFKKGGRLGDIIEVEAKVLYVGKSSMEVEMSARRGEEIIVTATGTYVKVDQEFRPVEIDEKVIPETREEQVKVEEAMKRREARLEKLANRNSMRECSADPTNFLRYRISNSLFVGPGMTYDGRVASAGMLLKAMDDLGGTLALRFNGIENYSPDSDGVVTVAVSDIFFYSPIRLGDVVEMNAGLTYVGKTSADILINVNRLDPKSGGCSHVTTAFFTYVRIDPQGNKKEMPEYVPATEQERELWLNSLRRRQRPL